MDASIAAIFGESSDEEEFFGFTDEELNINRNSDIEISDISSSGESDSDENKEEDRVEGDQVWTRNLTKKVIQPYSVENPGPTVVLGKEAKEEDFFDLSFPKEIYEILARETNLYALQKQVERIRVDSSWYETNAEEMKVYIGLRIFMSIVNIPEMKMYWAKDFAFGGFYPSKVMPRNRFDKLCQYIHANDRSMNELDDNGKPKDKLFLIRPVLDIVRAKCKENYIPPRDLSVDEAMISFRGQLGIRQYMPAKPTKYGIKMWQLCVAENGYCCDFSAYLGKPSDGEREKDLGKKVVLQMTESLRGQYNHIYYDNYFSSISLLEELLERRIYGCGTIRSNRVGLPQALRPKTKTNAGENLKLTLKNELKNDGDSVILQKGETGIVCLAWLEKKSRKPVLIASTTSSPDAPDSSVKRKQKNGDKKDVSCPKPVELYNQKVNGVDRCDQSRTEYSTGRMSKRWWLYIFYFLLDLAIANSLVLMHESPNHQSETKNGKTKNITMLRFRMALAKQLIGNFCGKKRRVSHESVATENQHWPLRTPTKRKCRNCRRKKQQRASEPRLKFKGCSDGDEQVNLCVDCFEGYHK